MLNVCNLENPSDPDDLESMRTRIAVRTTSPLWALEKLVVNQRHAVPQRDNAYHASIRAPLRTRMSCLFELTPGTNAADLHVRRNSLAAVSQSRTQDPFAMHL